MLWEHNCVVHVRQRGVSPALGLDLLVDTSMSKPGVSPPLALLSLPALPFSRLRPAFRPVAAGAEVPPANEVPVCNNGRGVGSESMW